MSQSLLLFFLHAPKYPYYIWLNFTSAETKFPGVGDSNRWAMGDQPRTVGRLVTHNHVGDRNMDIRALEDESSIEETYGCWDFWRADSQGLNNIHQMYHSDRKIGGGGKPQNSEVLQIYSIVLLYDCS